MQSDARRYQRLLRCAIGSVLVLAPVPMPAGGRVAALQAAPPAAQPAPPTDDLPVLATATDQNRPPEKPETVRPRPHPAGAADAVAPSAKDTLPDVGADAPGPADPPTDEVVAGPKVDRAPAPPLDIDPASFHGVQPGKSTADCVTETWGDPIDVVEDEDRGAVYIYAVEDFPRIQVRLADDRVASIVVDLETPMATQELADELGIAGIRAVDITDAKGQLLGRAFPERGVLFGFASQEDTTSVRQIILEPIGAEPFVLRVAADLHGPYQANLRDLDFAIAQDPDFARPYWLRAQVLLSVGRLADAEHAAASAVGLAPESPEYRLTRAACLARLERYAEAVSQVAEVLNADDLPDDVKARALLQMGDLVSNNGPHDGQKAIDYHVGAIKLASRHLSDPSAAARRAATETLVDAHLAVACDIGWGHWQQKSRVIPMWIERASALADQAIDRDGGSHELTLRVARRALHALVGAGSAIDPNQWVGLAEKAADAAVREVDDSLWRERIQRQLGMVYYHAVQLAHARGLVKQAIRYGHMALDRLMPELGNGNSAPFDRFVVGQLNFQMGAILAVHREDHFSAVEWYDKAAVGLVQPTPVSPEADPRRHGDALVSMGVSYWEVEQREKAVELTRLGAEMIQQAVTGGVADESALAVPYGNLAAMHEVLGDVGEARRFAELAKKSVQ